MSSIVQQPTAEPAEGHADDPVGTVVGIALGYLVSRSLHVATALGIADLLADGPKHVGELARQCGADSPSLYRLLRTLAAHGVFAEEDERVFRLTAPAFLLQSGVMRDGLLLCGEVAGDGSWWSAVGDLRHAVTTGEPSFDHLHGAGFFEYISRDPECMRWFDRGMANFAAAENPAVAAAYDFAAAGRIVDVGGGQGGLLAEILRRTPDATGTLFDLAQVVADPAQLASETALAGRWDVASGDFFQAVPAGAAVYVLKRILHDWSDDDAVRILRACRAAMPENGRVLVVDSVLPPGNAPHPAKVMDILMMVFAGGRERTEAELTALLEAAGLALERVIPTASVLAIVEARGA